LNYTLMMSVEYSAHELSHMSNQYQIMFQ